MNMQIGLSYFNCLICGKQHTFRLVLFYLMRNTDRVMTMIYLYKLYTFNIENLDI